VDYKVLYDAFFKHQTKPTNLTKFGDTYYEGKELEVSTQIQPGRPLSKALRAALGMTSETSPPPWLWNFQRYGPPPSYYPHLKIPGLNAPLPTPECQYGFHPGGWGQPPVDAYGRLIYGGNPLDPPGSGAALGDDDENDKQTLITSDGKMLQKAPWGGLPMGYMGPDGDDNNDEEEEEYDDEEEEDAQSENMDDEVEVVEGPWGGSGGVESFMPPPPSAVLDLRKPGDETPLHQPAQAQPLYQVLSETKAVTPANAVFASQVAYVLPTGSAVPEGGIASVLAKAAVPKTRGDDDPDDDDKDDRLGKNFKF
jgi:splicing factor 3B subunit 2